MMQCKSLILVVVAVAAVLASSSAARAQSTSELLEKGIYTEETVGDLEAAIEIYDQIVSNAQADRPHVAQALLRMGLCYLKNGQEKEAGEALEKLIKDFPDQPDLVAQARQHLPEKQAPELVLNPAPWEDGEMLKLTMKMPGGMEIGSVIKTVESETGAGKNAWRIDSYLIVSLSNMQQFTSVEAEQDSFRPITGRTKHSMLGDTRALYSPDKVEVTTGKDGEESTRQVKVDRVVYDNEQAVYLMRRLPLTEGYKTTIPIFTRFGETIDIGLEVLTKETVNVPAGTFECYKTNLMPVNQQLWFSADKNQYLVKFEANSVVVELTEITRLDNKPASYQDAETGISLSAPVGWYLLRCPFANPSLSFWLQMLPPELKAKATLCSMKMGTMSMPVLDSRGSAEMDITTLKGVHQVYTVREDSWTDLEVGGIPAVSYIADFLDKDRNMVDYRIYVAKKPDLYWFVFVVEKDQFEADKGEFDSIVASFSLKEK